MFENQTAFNRAGTHPIGSAVVLGAGPVARAVVTALGQHGVEPLVVSRRGTPVAGGRAAAVDIGDADALAGALRGADAVFQCAQPAYHRWVDEFLVLQRSVLRAMRGSDGVLVAVENCYGYGPVDAPMTESTPMRPSTRKGRVRAAMWDELAAAHRAGEVATAAVRASDFIGVGVDNSAFGSRFVRPIVAGGRVRVLGDADCLHSVTFVPDLGRAMVRVAEQSGAWGQVWHAPNAPAISQRELAALVAAAAGRPSPRVGTVAPWQLRLAGAFVRPIRETIEMAYQFEHDFVVDSSRFEQHFGDRATPLADAVATIVTS